MVDQALITNDYGEPAIGAFARFGGSPQDVIAPWLVVQPDAQFFFAPAFSRRDAYALGVEIAVIF